MGKRDAVVKFDFGLFQKGSGRSGGCEEIRVCRSESTPGFARKDKRQRAVEEALR